MPANKKYTAYICRDCEIDFQTSRSSRGGTFCPNCGENLYTQKIKDVWMPRLFMKARHWTAEEEDQIRTGIKAGQRARELMEVLHGRSWEAVRKRILKIEKEEFSNDNQTT